jgi:hypothetical protein
LIFENVGPNQAGDDKNKFRILAPPSMSALNGIFRRALAIGNLIWGENFTRKCQLRRGLPGFNSVDLINVIRRCNIIGGPTYNAVFHGWQYELADRIDGHKFVVVVCLDGTADYLTNPQITVLSGNFQTGKINRKRRGLDDLQKENKQGGHNEDA